MRFSIPATIVLAQALAFVTAQDVSQSDSSSVLQQLAELPECALNCITVAMPASSCAFGDLECLCVDPQFIESTGTCIQGNCTVKQALTSERWQKDSCNVPVENRGAMTLGVTWALFGAATLAVVLRFLCRTTFVEGQLGWDDWTILMAYGLLVPCTALVQVLVDKGLGQNIWMVPFDNITDVLYYFYIEEFMYIGNVMITKISIVLLYMRIIPRTVSPRFNTLCLVLIGLMVVTTISFFVPLALTCNPRSYIWTQWTGETEGKCLDEQAQIYSAGIINILWDGVVFVLPIPKLANLQVRDARKKILVILTFLIGLIGTICSIARLKYLTEWGKVTNVTMHYNAIAIWSAVEGELGVICACMPAIAGPFLQLCRKVVGSSFLRSIYGYSWSKSRFTDSTGMSKDSKGIHRCPSSGDQSHSDTTALNNGGISKTVESTMYNLSVDANSDDDVELMDRKHGNTVDAHQHEKRPAPGRGHEYAGTWR